MRAKKSLGQNFLVDPNLQRKIVDAVEPGPGDTVIEVGPGQGALTDRLADAAGRLVAVELDDRLAEALARRFDGHPTVTLVHADVLEWEPGDLLDRETVKVVGNIPYNITSPLLFRLLEWQPAPERVVVMVQREVADRILARPGEKAYGALTVGIRAVADVERLFHVGRGAFRPVPNVDSTVIEIRPRDTGTGATAGPDGAAHEGPGADGTASGGRTGMDDLGPEGPETLRALTRAAFGLRRKQLQKILRIAPGYGLEADAAEAVLEEVGVEPTARPETLDPATFVALAAALARRGYPRGEPGS